MGLKSSHRTKGWCMMSTISILGLYDWDNTIFDTMIMPSFQTEDETITLDRDILKNNILVNLGELETVFPDSDAMKQILQMWSASRVGTWNRMFEVLATKYDPFVNIKRDELREIKQERDLKGSLNNKVNAWNDLQPVDKNSSDSTDTGTIVTTEHFHVEGDSAITDAQDVLKKEMEVRNAFNIYDIITEEFKQRFCVMVY